MKEFIAIDFETANPQRVSACAIGYAKISDCIIVETGGYLVKPVGGHAEFQSKIHGIKDEHTCDKPLFGEFFPQIRNIFNYPLVAHSLFDKQVLTALSDHFSLELKFDYIDSCALAKNKLPDLTSHNLKTLVKHFKIPSFKHHDAKEDAVACAKVFLLLQDLEVKEMPSFLIDKASAFTGMVKGILADGQVNYKEAYELLYWLEDNAEDRVKYKQLYIKIKAVLEDNQLDSIEAEEIKLFLENALKKQG